MVTAKKQQSSFNTLEEIRLRKEELENQIQKDNSQISSLWNQVFVKREDTTKGDYIASIVTNSITVIDLFLLFRKFKKNYGSLFGRRKKR